MIGTVAYVVISLAGGGLWQFAIASLVLGAASVVVGIGFLAIAMLRTQLKAGEADFVGAAARFWILVVAAWMVSPVALYGLMSAK